MSEFQPRIYEEGASTVWIPVSSRSPEGTARAFLPFNGMDGIYTHGFKANPVRSPFFDALVSIQNAYLVNEERVFRTRRRDEKQRSDKWRHGNKKSSPLLGPTLGWVEVPVASLTQITSEELTVEIERSGANIISSKRCRVDPEGPMFRAVAAEARTFQLEFRVGALELWGAKCALSGATCLLEAAHIKSVSACKSGDQLGLTDPFNSIILNVALHGLLDEGLISFADDGDLLVSEALGPHDRSVYGVSSPKRVTFHPSAIQYIRYHRQNVYRNQT